MDSVQCMHGKELKLFGHLLSAQPIFGDITFFHAIRIDISNNKGICFARSNPSLITSPLQIPYIVWKIRGGGYPTRSGSPDKIFSDLASPWTFTL